LENKPILDNPRFRKFIVKKAIRSVALLMAVSMSFWFGILPRTVSGQSPHRGASMSGYLPQRVYSTREKRFIDFEMLVSEAIKGDVLFVGEQHDDPATHRIELAVLESAARRRTNVVLAMEMFERDVQPVVNDYLAGRITPEDFLAKSRPWPNFMADYHFLVEFAKSHGWKVIASNVPRPYASAVSHNGLSALDKLAPAERINAAKQIECPNDDYRKRFAEAMGGHPGPSTGNAKEDAKAAEAMGQRFYEAQCIKDETMAESIANLLNPTAADKPFVVHVNGSFHSDYHEGTAARVSRRMPKAGVKTVSVIPVDNLDNVEGADKRDLADYLVFVLKPKEKE
jgi:uncharacterized iron-regulated protein